MLMDTSQWSHPSCIDAKVLYASDLEMTLFDRPEDVGLEEGSQHGAISPSGLVFLSHSTCFPRQVCYGTPTALRRRRGSSTSHTQSLV